MKGGTMKAFPILYQGTTRLDHWPIAIEWAEIIFFEFIIKENHCQSLNTVAKRGGLSPMELYMAIKGFQLNDKAARPISDIVAMERMIKWPMAWIYGQNNKTG
jgi:hypothetical protein